MSSVQLRAYPGSKRLLMHPHAGRRARSIRTLSGSSDWRRDIAERVGELVVLLTGPARWPEQPASATWPELTTGALLDALSPSLPGVRIVGAVRPRQAGRQRLSLLCRYAGNMIVVKLGVDEDGASMRTEAEALRLLMKRPLPGIETPDVIACATIGGDRPIDMLATSSIGLRSQRPAIDVALRTFEADLTQRLSTLGDADSRSSDMTPAHGDLTPWNLRRTRRGLALFDWESAGWAPAGADLAMYREACDQVRPWWQRRPTP